MHSSYCMQTLTSLMQQNIHLDYEKLSVMDKWLLSKLNSAIKRKWMSNLANYRIPEAAKALDEFVDDMSNWYVRRSRDRFWAKGMEQDKINAYMTLYTALVDDLQGCCTDDPVHDRGDLSEPGTFHRHRGTGEHPSVRLPGCQ